MTHEEQTEFTKRLTRYIANELAKSEPERAPLVRLHLAYKAAENIIVRAKWAGITIETLRNNLAKLESTDWEI